MANVAIIAESSCNLPAELVAQYGIQIIPLQIKPLISLPPGRLSG